MSELSPLRDTHKFDVNLLIPLMRLAGSTEPLHEMARALGGVYVDFLPVSDAAHPVHGQCMASVKSVGDMMVGTAKALEDNMTLLEEHGFPGIQEAYRRHCCTLGSRVHVIGTEIDFIGTAEDIDETGALLVRDESGVLQRVLSGDVSVRGVMGYV